MISMAAIIIDDILKTITIEKVFCVFIYEVNAFVS